MPNTLRCMALSHGDTFRYQRYRRPIYVRTLSKHSGKKTQHNKSFRALSVERQQYSIVDQLKNKKDALNFPIVMPHVEILILS